MRVHQQQAHAALSNTIYRCTNAHTHVHAHVNPIPHLLGNILYPHAHTTTPTGLQTVYDKYHEHGLEILAFPSNQWGHEPGSNQDIRAFARRMGVTFPFFDKVRVCVCVCVCV